MTTDDIQEFRANKEENEIITRYHSEALLWCYLDLGKFYISNYILIILNFNVCYTVLSCLRLNDQITDKFNFG